MSDFHSLAERLGFSFCRYLFKRKHVCCLISAWHLTIFSDQSDNFFYFFMLAVWRSNEEKTYSIVIFLKAFKGRILPQLSTSDTTGAVPVCFSFICVYFSLFFGGSNTVCWDLIAAIRAELEKNHFPVSKVSTTLTLLQNLPHCEPSPLHFSAVFRTGSAGCTEALFCSLWGIVAISFYQNVFFCKLSTVCYLGGKVKSWREATKPLVSLVT